MENNNFEARPDEISLKAMAMTEATVYSLNNPYMTRLEKAQVEAVYQIPYGVMDYTIIYFLLIYHFPPGQFPFGTAFIIGTMVSAGAWGICLHIPPKLALALSFVLCGNVRTLVCVAAAAICAWSGRYGGAVYLGLAAFGITCPIQLPMWLWMWGWIWSPYQSMHFKYKIAKRLFGITFPFEQHLK